MIKINDIKIRKDFTEITRNGNGIVIIKNNYSIGLHRIFVEEINKSNSQQIKFEWNFYELTKLFNIYNNKSLIYDLIEKHFVYDYVYSEMIENFIQRKIYDFHVYLIKNYFNDLILDNFLYSIENKNQFKLRLKLTGLYTIFWSKLLQSFNVRVLKILWYSDNFLKYINLFDYDEEEFQNICDYILKNKEDSLQTYLTLNINSTENDN